MTRPSTKRRHLEDDLQRQAAAFLRVALPPGWLFWSTPNGGARSAVTAAILKATGTRPGIPDLFAYGDGRLIGIELKRPLATLKSLKGA